ncbi:MAG: YetF domain-containing protein [Ginsengibacter sp.]
MMDIIHNLFGEGRDLTSLQMGCRAFVMLFIALFLIRLGGMRTFGIKSAFDNCIIIMLGAVISRAITGASAFIPTIAAALVLVIVHKILAILSVNNKTLSHIVKGKPVSIYKDGVLNTKNLKKCSLSYGDIMEEVRMVLNTNVLDDVEEIFMERNGKISIIKKQ